MADYEGTDVDITHDVFLIHANEPDSEKIFALRKLEPLLKKAGLKVFTSDKDFQSGQVVMDNIAMAVRRCRKSVIVLTKHSKESPWCSLELLLALEKSHRHNIMSLVVLRIGDVVEERLDINQINKAISQVMTNIPFDESSDYLILGVDKAGAKLRLLMKRTVVLKYGSLDMLNTVPHIDIENYDKIDNKIDDLICKIRETKRTEELLPAGNIAHAQVWSHYFGLLQYLLPEIESLIKRTDLYKKDPNRFSLKLYELVPEDCCCPSVVEDIPECTDESAKRIVVMKEKLPPLSYTRSGNSRKVEMAIYGVRDKSQEYYCVAEYPSVVTAIQKMVKKSCTKLEECDKWVQLGRFYYTLNALLRHESLPTILNKARVIMYNARREGFVLADEMLKAIKEDLNVKALNEGQVQRPLDSLNANEPPSYEFEAFLFYDDSDDTNKSTKVKIANYLETKNIKFLSEDDRSGQRKFNLEMPMQKCYWTIVILTGRSLQNYEFTLKVLSLLESYLGEKQIRFIPVLVDTRYCDIPDAIRFVTYVGVDEQDKYLERLCCTLQGKAIPFDKESLIPAGNVGYGLAWAYVLNYLDLVLKDVGNSINEFLKVKNKSSSIHKKKIYIIAPFSCDCKTTLSEADGSISKLGTIQTEDKHIGNMRKYTFDVYTFMDGKKEYVFAGQYAAPVTCLNEMMKVRIAGISEEDMVKQSRIFCHETELILAKKFKDLLESCEIVYYDDAKCQLSTEMKRRLTNGE